MRFLPLQLLFILMSVCSTTVSAGLWETLLMPGDLTSAHKKYEKECDKCHLSFDQESQVSLCRNCHEKIDKDIIANKGFHGNLYSKSGQECRDCHTDHKGESADIVSFIKKTFDHDLTDFRLTGSHQSVQCHLCHREDKKYRDASHTCISCHKKKDIHKEELGKKCDNCHEAGGWSKTKYDHSKTKFPLKDKHQDVNCVACHPDQAYKKTPKACISCHKLQDKHGSLFGDKCKQCHSEKGWDKAGYDHDTKTKFKLKGKHKKANCHSCHTDETKGKKLAHDCVSCHQSDDVHQGSQGKKCHACHSEEKWAVKKFDHSKNARLALQGRHKELSCYTCHAEVKETGQKNRTCRDCHQQDDFHHGQQGDHCQKCHSEEGWKRKFFLIMI